jgi:putative Holliday junction resolvase
VSRVLGVDLGERRIGVAVCDDGRVLATPYDTIKRVGNRTTEHSRLIELLFETGATTVVVGLPLGLDGEDGDAARSARSEARGLQKRLRREEIDVDVELIDERFTTVTAHQQLRAGGLDGRQRRQVVDATAAAVLLQAWLDRG